MYPKRLILDDARNHGIAVLPLDVNRSGRDYLVEPVGDGYGIRLALAEVKGISEAEVLVSAPISPTPTCATSGAVHR